MAYMPWIITAVAALLIIVLTLSRGASGKVATRSAASRGEGTGRGLSVVLPSKPLDASSQRAAEKAKVTLRDRLMHAGLYQESSMQLLRITRFVFLGLMVFGGYLCSTFGLVSLGLGLTLGLLGGVLGTIAPGFFLDYLKGRRQSAMRRALPDALDIIVVSLEGGLPVAASFQRVSNELEDSHALLAAELSIVERELKMGRSLGQATVNMAARFDLDELRSMASVIQQSEKYGAGVTRAFKIFSDGLRQTRQRRAEEMAHKAAIKLMFPTILFIFPAMFVVILAPAVFRFMELIRSFNHDLQTP